MRVDFFQPYAELLPGGAGSAGLVLASDGNYYGAELRPGQNPCRPQEDPGRDCGVIIRVTPQGEKTILYRFGLTAGDGYGPGPVVLGDDGVLYGVTNNGGAFGGGGTLYRITLTGSYSLLHSFGGNGDGAGPGFLAKASDGNLYGVTASGGTNRCPAIPSDGPNCGTVFRATPSGQVTVLHSFGSFAGDGILPEARLVEGADGRLYGTTQIGGANACGSSPNSCGTLFSIGKSGGVTILHSFGSSEGDGIAPRTVIRGPGSSILGLTVSGGGNRCNTNFGCGTIYSYTPGSQLTILYAFGRQDQSDGSGPSSLTLGSDGNIYGTTVSGGRLQCSSCGTVFRLTTSGQLTTLYSFGPVNASPSSPTLISRAPNGVLYGFMQFVTTFDGSQQYFRLTEL